MSFVMIPTEIFEAELTNLQFRFISNFIRISKINNGHSFFGYPNLAEINQCGRAAAIKTVQELEKMGFIKVVERGNKSRSNDILLTLEEGISRLSAGELGEEQGYLNHTPEDTEGYLKDTPQESLNNTPKESLNDTRGYLKDTPGYLKDTPYKEEYLNKLYLNKKNARRRAREGYLLNTPNNVSGEEKKAEFLDVAENRSMPTSGGAGSASEAMLAGSQLDIEDLCLWQAFKEEFPRRYAWFQLVRAQNQLIMRGIGKMGDDMLERAWGEVFAWFSKRGFHIARAEQNQRFNSEIVIKEAV